MGFLPDATMLLRPYARRQLRRLEGDPATGQRQVLQELLDRSAPTRFGRDHDFAALSRSADPVAAFQAAVPLRRFEDMWDAYFKSAFPLLDDISWPGRMPFFAETSGTTSGRTKYIPVSHDMVAANRRAALTTLALELANHKDARPLAGKTFMLGGSTALTELAPGVFSGDLSGIATRTTPFWARPYSFPDETLALESDWDRKLDTLARAAPDQPIAAISGVPSWVLLLFERMSAIHQTPLNEVVTRLLPGLRLYIHGGTGYETFRSRFDPIFARAGTQTREVYPASEGFIAIQDRGSGEGLRLLAEHGVFYEFVPTAELDSQQPTRHWLGTVETGIDYAVVMSNNAGLFGHILGDTVRFVSTDPPRLLISGRTAWTLSAFGEHVIGEELIAAVTHAARTHGTEIAEFTVAPVYPGDTDPLGRHVYVLETSDHSEPGLADRLAEEIDAHLCADNDDYRVHREGDVQLAAPRAVLLPPGSFAAWMARRGKLGGQNKVPRVVEGVDQLDGLFECQMLLQKPGQP